MKRTSKLLDCCEVRTILTNDKVNQLLGITESYQAPARMLDLILDDVERPKLFESFLAIEKDLSQDWFVQYFEDEHADRKVKKQDFTPLSISKLMAKMVSQGKSYFEPAVGTGSIMIQTWNEQRQLTNYDSQEYFYHLEEMSDRAIPFLLFNMGIRKMNGVVYHGNALTDEFDKIYGITDGDIFVISEGSHELYDSVAMNPPYSASWSADKSFLNDPRFTGYGALAPKSKADFAFLLHGFYRLKKNGVMAVVLPHGVLFRGNAEGKIRKDLLESGAIEAVIGLPGNLFNSTQIPTTVIVLRKNRDSKDVLFIDASKEFEKGKNQNFLTDKHIHKILETYRDKTPIDKYSHLAEWAEIKENDFNLNIPRYVDTFEEPEPIDIVEVAHEIIMLDKEIDQANKEFVSMLRDLTGGDDGAIEATIAAFGGSKTAAMKNDKANQLELF